MMAVRAGRDDLAKEALVRKTEHDTLSLEFQKQWELQKSATDKLRHALRLLNNKIGEAKRKKDLLVARQRKAQANEQIRKAMDALADNGAFDTFARMEDKILREEAEAEAAAELAGIEGDELVSKFEDFEAKHGADDALYALKVKMGVAAPAVEEEPEEELTEAEFDLSELEALEEALSVSSSEEG